MASETSEVIGHYVCTQDGVWAPALQQSTELFKAVVADDISSFERQIEASGAGPLGWFSVLYWSDGKEQAAPRVEAKTRSLAMIATQHGSLRILSYLLAKGCNPKQCCPGGGGTGEGCYEFIEASNPNAPTIRAMLDDAAGNFAVTGEAPAGPGASVPGAATPEATNNSCQPLQSFSQQELDQADLQDLPYSTADLTRPEYSTDTFRMYCFKVLRCSKRYAHDWRACPFAHPTENARRRDPREFRYSSLVCPDYRQGCCVRGDTCQYAHGVFESWLHPSRYRTQLCKDQEKCDRPVCFFAHTINELRTPVDSFVPNPEERLRVPEATQVVLGIAPPSALSVSSGGADIAYGSDQGAITDQLLSPAQRAGSSSSIPHSSSGGGAAGSSSGGGANDFSQIDQTATAAAGSGGAGGSPSPNKQLVSPTAVPVPRMSNAFARKHGLDPKDNPLVNLQRIALQQTNPQQQHGAGAGGRRQRRGRGHQQCPSPQPQLLQQLPLQGPPPHQLMQPPLSPAAAAAAYYGAPAAAPMGALQHGANPHAPPQLIDPQAMAILFGGMNLAGPPLSPAAAAAMAGGMPGMGMFQQQQGIGAYGMAPGHPMGGMSMGLAVGGLPQPGGLGPPSPLNQPGIHSPQPPPF